jgi:hypothetical protein
MNRTSGQTARITELRGLRRRAREIYRDTRADLQAFQRQDGTFCTYPPPVADKIHVTTTCTALMALSASRLVHVVCPMGHEQKDIATVFELVVDAAWESEGLEADNAFTVALVLRAAGFLAAEHNLQNMSRESARELKHIKKSSLAEIGKRIADDASKDFAEAFGVRVAGGSSGKYPPKAAIVYWYVDGIDSLEIDIGQTGWATLIRWAAREFNQQLARVASGDDALMDPVSMAMSACLVARLKKIMQRRGSNDDDLAQLFPSQTELKHAVGLLFKYQRPSGIWPKYFPMFHFRNAGANYCFTFEMLEALVTEIDPIEMLEVPGVLAGLGSALDWCVLNRFEYRIGNDKYCGWNSGGSINTLLASKPESWATATVHWFLHRLDEALSNAIEHAIFQKYGVAKPIGVDEEDWNKLADATVELGDSKSTVKDELRQLFITPLRSSPPDRRVEIEGYRSALLFGPPGTAKTTLVRELAKSMGWPCVEIKPSNFLRRGLDNIYVVADEIFEDLVDLARSVIFFDEMDALVQSRNIQLDVTRQFLTTSMLPKLAGLHDEGRSVFFMATNYRATFDEAVTRPGRFDLLLFVGPPSWQEKLRILDQIVFETRLGRPLKRSAKKEDKETTKAIIEELRVKLEQWVRDGDLSEKMGRFTYGETKSLVGELFKNTGGPALADAVRKLNKEDFVRTVNDWASKYIILRQIAGSGDKQNDTYTNYVVDLTASRRQ